MCAMTLFSQMDPQWKGVLLGDDPKLTIGKYGCLLTSMTMLASAYGCNETPPSLNEKMKRFGGYQGALIIPARLPAALPSMRFVDFRVTSHAPAPLAEIDAWLAQGEPVIVEVDYAPAAGLQTHWVVVYDRQGDDYLIRDPYPYPNEAKPVTLAGRFGFTGGAAEIIQAVLFLDGGGGAGPAPGPSLPRPYKLNLPDQASFPVYAAVDGLALRTEPRLADDTLIKREPLNARLTALEKDVPAQAKLGQLNQWLPVRDPAGDEGYCAAWYVSAEKPAAEPPPAAPPPAPAGPARVVQVTAAALALRQAPRLNGKIIKYEPAGAQLLLLEDAAQAQAKLGVQGQWLNVQDVQGEQGYTAAWYVAPAVGLVGLGPFSGAGGPPPAADTSTPLVVRAVEDQLAFRSQPMIAEETLIGRVPLNTEFLALEPEDVALAKLGQAGQWLRVQDINGRQGYVAAWYVAQRRAPGK